MLSQHDRPRPGAHQGKKDSLAARVAKRNEVGSHSGHPRHLLLTRQQAHRAEGSHLRPDALALEQIYWYLVTPEDLFLKENIYI